MCARCQQAEKRNKFSKKRSVHSLKPEERGPVFTTFPVVCRTEILAPGLRSSDSIFHQEPIVLSVAWGSPAGASSDSTRLNISIFQLYWSLTHFLGWEINKVDYWGSFVLPLWSSSCTYLLSLQSIGLPFAPWGPEALLPPCRSEPLEIQWWMCHGGRGLSVGVVGGLAQGFTHSHCQREKMSDVIFNQRQGSQALRRVTKQSWSGCILIRFICLFLCQLKTQ